jgi:hypothetical protein
MFPIHLEEGEFCVKTWSENELFIDDCRPYFHDTGKRFRAGMAIGEVWRFKDGPTRKIIPINSRKERKSRVAN